MEEDSEQMNRDDEEQNDELNKCIHKSMIKMEQKITALWAIVALFDAIEVSAVQQMLSNALVNEMKDISRQLQNMWAQMQIMLLQKRAACYAKEKVKKLNAAAELLNDADALLKQAAAHTKKTGKAAGSTLSDA